MGEATALRRIPRSRHTVPLLTLATSRTVLPANHSFLYSRRDREPLTRAARSPAPTPP